MTKEQRLKYLGITLRVVGLLFIFAIYPMMIWVWPSDWGWEPPQPEYEQMIMGIYATLGVFLLIAARNPMAHLSLIWFTIWSSIVHGGIMFVQAIVDMKERDNLMGDIPALFLVAIALWVFMPRKRKA